MPIEDHELPAISVSDLLVVRGVSSTDELASLGLPFAESFARASDVILVGGSGGRPVKGRGISGSVRFVDVDSSLSVLATALERIADEFRRANPHPKLADAAHCHVGRFLIFCHINHDDDHPVSVIDLVRQGRIEEVREASRAYIESGFEQLYVQLGGISTRQDAHHDSAGDASTAGA